MTRTTRRDAFKFGFGAAAVSSLAISGHASATPGSSPEGISPAVPIAKYRRGIEGQRKADQDNGRLLNPVLAGDHPDPSILKDGDIYYKVSSSFLYYPALLVWRSTDLVNWSPISPALTQPIGSVYAADIAKHDGRYFIYFGLLNFPAAPKPALAPGAAAGSVSKRPIAAVMVVTAPSMTGPWSDPVDVGVYDGIDPGHVVGEDGKRYLYYSGGKVVKLTDDGLKTDGLATTVYKGWQYPDDWVVEGFSLEGPKLLRRDGWFYMFSAEGGTAGPPTSHMIVVARSRSVRGPWENCPNNPIVKTMSATEAWWSRGHGTPVEGPAGDWWFVYHGYENGFRTLGRQMLLDPFEWTNDGWPISKKLDLAQPISKPAHGKASPHGVAFSSDFSHNKVGTAYTFYNPAADYLTRTRVESGSLIMDARGATPGESSPLLLNVGDRSYQMTVHLSLANGAHAGLVVFYNEKLFCALETDGKNFRQYKMGAASLYDPVVKGVGGNLFLRVVNRENVASFYYSEDGKAWKLHSSFEVAGYNHNIGDGFISLRPGLFVTKAGAAAFHDLTYTAIV